MMRSLILAVTALTLSGAAASAQTPYVGPGYGYAAPAYMAPAPAFGGAIYDYAPGYAGSNYAPGYAGYNYGPAPDYYFDAYTYPRPNWGWGRGW